MNKLLTVSSYHLLKKFSKSSFSESLLSVKEKETFDCDIEMLSEHSFISCKITGYNFDDSEFGKTVYSDYQITGEGLSFLHRCYVENIEKWVPHVIAYLLSVSALIVSVIALSQ